ncbi:putative manganese-dependent inorganic diphosphatase [Proteinivorax hydrogeniformans]|uniref:inorganic diphosphatase n=1 Tax=Proteinivorax hydrogeniformans TaxID=1826727 RepID=A0AAU8HUZ9_9FIRM
MNETIVIGHKNPDTDSIASAIAYSELKNRLGEKCIAKRSGSLNPETEHILNVLAIEAPEYIESLELSVKELLTESYQTLQKDETLKRIGTLMQEEEIKSLPLLNANGTLAGVITPGDFAKLYLQEIGSGEISYSKILLKNAVENLNATVFHQGKDTFLTGRILIGAMDTENLEHSLKPNDTLVIGDRVKGQRVAILRGVSTLILTGGCKPRDEILELAKEFDVNLLGFMGDSFTAARLLALARSGSDVMTESPQTVVESTKLSELKKLFSATQYRAFPVVDESSRFKGIITKGDVINATSPKVILVDHSETSQGIEGLNWGEVVEIIDHHRLGDIQTQKPIPINCRPVGSTATLVAEQYFIHNIELSPKMAALLLSALISDTVMLKSPTTTSTDANMAKKLAEIAGVSLKDFGREVYKWTEKIADLSADELLNQDLKEFEFSGGKVAIGQVETTSVDKILDQKSEFLKAMEYKSVENGYKQMMFIITDIVCGDSYAICYGDDSSRLAEAFNQTLQKSIVFLPGVMSRKLQVVPVLGKIFSESV